MQTIDIVKRTYSDIKTILKCFRFFGIAWQIIFISYQFFMLLSGSDIWYAHLALLVVSFAYLVYDLVMSNNIDTVKNDTISKKDKKHLVKKLKSKRRLGKKIKKYASHVISGFVILTSIITLCISSDVRPFSIVITTLVTTLWIAKIIIEVAEKILLARVRLFEEAFQSDLRVITHPIETLKVKLSNFFKKKQSTESPREQAETPDADSQEDERLGISGWLADKISKRKRAKAKYDEESEENDSAEDEKV